MKRLYFPWLLATFTQGSWAADDLPVTVLPPVTTEAEESLGYDSTTRKPSSKSM